MLARLRFIQARLLPRGPVDVVRQVLLFAAAYYGYRLVRGAVDDPLGAAAAFKNARELISIEQSLHIFVEPSVQAWAASKPVIIDFASWVYINAQVTVTVSALVYLYLRHNTSFYFVRNMFVVWSLYPLLVTFVVVSTANHFITDAILGALTAALGAWAAAWMASARPANWAFQPA